MQRQVVNSLHHTLCRSAAHRSLRGHQPALGDTRVGDIRHCVVEAIAHSGGPDALNEHTGTSKGGRTLELAGAAKGGKQR